MCSSFSLSLSISLTCLSRHPLHRHFSGGKVHISSQILTISSPCFTTTALLDDVPGIEVQIVVQDHVLHEYQDRSAQVSAKTTERYMEAQFHAQFEIHYAFREPFPSDRPVAMIVTIDGKTVDEPLIRASELFEPQGHSSRGPISSIGLWWMVQKYCFSPIDISTYLDSISCPSCLRHNRRR
jgi:hypothetical protein